MFFLKMLNVNKDLLMEQILSRDKYDPVSLNAICFLEESLSKKQIWMNVNEYGVIYYILVVFYIVCAIVKELGKIVCRFPIRCWFKGYCYFSQKLDGKVVFVVPPLNDYRSLKRVIDIVSKNKSNVFVLDKKEYYNAFPRLLILIKSFFSIFHLLNNVSSLPSDMRYIAYKYIDALFLSSGFTYCARKVLENSSPECIVFANDHSYDRRALIYACEEKKIKTVYVQHASVSYAFPELHTTYNFLDGIDALEKYTEGNKETHGKVILLGAIRYDGLQKYKMRRKSYKRNCIGLAINSMDDLCVVNDFVSKLLIRFSGMKIKIRCHPAMKKRLHKQRQRTHIIYTYASDENIIDYLDSIDLQIAGDSGVHLDAILGGVPSLAYNFSSKSKSFGDNYNYVSCGMIPYAESFDQVENFIVNKIKSVDKKLVKFYDEAFGKSYAGACSEIVAEFIMSGCDFSFFVEKHNMEEVMYNDMIYYALLC